MPSLGTSGNDVNAITDGSAICTRQYTADTTPLTLAPLSLGHQDNPGTMTFTFSETVDPSTLNPGYLLLQDALPASVSYQLTCIAASAVSLTAVLLTLTATEPNEMIFSAVTNLYSTGYLSFARDAICNMRGNSNLALSGHAAQQVTAMTLNTAFQLYTSDFICAEHQHH